MKKNEDNLRDLWDNIKCTNFRIIGVPGEEEKEKGSEKIFEEIIVESILTMGKEITTQFQEAQRVQYKVNPKRNMPRHILIKLTKIKFKEKILKAAREKQKHNIQENPYTVISCLFSDSLSQSVTGKTGQLHVKE